MTKVFLHPKPRDFNFEGYLNHFFCAKKKWKVQKKPIELMFFAFNDNLIIILYYKNIKRLVDVVHSCNE